MNGMQDFSADDLLDQMEEMQNEIEQKNDRSVEAGDILSVRGYGKYVVRSISTPTKKGRLRILADKYQ